MNRLIGLITNANTIVWQNANPNADISGDEGIEIAFTMGGGSERQALRLLAEILTEQKVDWLSRDGDGWHLNTDLLKKTGYLYQDGLEWLRGMLKVEPTIKTEGSVTGFQTSVAFEVYKEEFLVRKNRRIFLSHKSADKPLVRQFFETLKLLGFDPWLDEDAMPAGAELHRAIQQGFHDSCAAVFFITPSFRDEAFLRSEINHAVAEKTAKGDRFAIVSLSFPDENGAHVEPPDPLRSYLWKEPTSQLDALKEILRALPLAVGTPFWRP